ncbi:class I SAM-dependent methyltransferase [Plantactinospora soyae]|uniref:SAM-dependent methyltransferase n=1 Tax=Plantactinospora soyae TaxID=1544732 RepID=A0A927RAY6_9ACTN|nr:class I SAM-dependent methyltransferase [Plantactinospora soyae]MBE1491146.1 SAM-dependent methyltransferase [Plantactinospora soyae]
MGLGFKGDVVDFYQRYRRGYPAPVVDALTAALRLDAADVVLDLGCGTGQLTLPLAQRVRGAIGMDPEPDMLERARDVARERQTANVTWMLGADTDVPAMGAVLGNESLGAVTIGQALHWMNPDPLFTNLLPYLRPGGAVAVVTNGRPAWMHDSTWSHALRTFLERWLGEPLTYACGTDAASQQRYAANLRAAGLTVSEKSHEYMDTIDLEHLIGGVYSAFSADRLPARGTVLISASNFERPCPPPRPMTSLYASRC